MDAKKLGEMPVFGGFQYSGMTLGEIATPALTRAIPAGLLGHKEHA